MGQQLKEAWTRSSWVGRIGRTAGSSSTAAGGRMLAEGLNYCIDIFGLCDEQRD
jgi:hypothetical protein